MTGYYVEDLDSLPIELVAAAMSCEVPRSIAIACIRWQRFWSRLGWRAKATGATKWEPAVTWRLDSPPAQALTQWGPWLEQLDDQGFEQIGWTQSPTIGDKREANLWLASDDGTIFAQLNWTLIGAVEDGCLSLQSFLPDGSELLAVSIRHRWQSKLLKHIKPDYVDLVSVKTNSLAKLIQAHRDRFKPGEPPSLLTSEFKARLPNQVERIFQHSIKQGFLRELNYSEVRRLIGEQT